MRTYLISLTLVAALAACSRAPETREVDAATIDSLKIAYRVINDSLSKAWDVMIVDDDQKLNYMKRLLDEITFTNNYDQAKVQDLYSRIEKVRNMRYDRRTMASSTLIDEYDFAIKNLINELETYANSNPIYGRYALIKELLGDIRAADDRVLFLRSDYDDFAKEMNTFIEVNRDLQKQITTDTFEIQPLFELPPESI